MLTAINEEDVGKSLRVPIPHPTPVFDKQGKQVLDSYGLPKFGVKSQPADHEMGRKTSVTSEFVDKYIISAGRAKQVELAVLYALVKTTNWSEAKVIVNSNGQPILNDDRRAEAVIIKYGNRTSTQTISDLAKITGFSYGAVQKALSFWVRESVMKEIKAYPKQRPRQNLKKDGRPEKSFRYEFDPRYVWNGYNFLGAALDYLQNLKDIQIIDH